MIERVRDQHQLIKRLSLYFILKKKRLKRTFHLEVSSKLHLCKSADLRLRNSQAVHRIIFLKGNIQKGFLSVFDTKLAPTRCWLKIVGQPLVFKHGFPLLLFKITKERLKNVPLAQNPTYLCLFSTF